MTKKYTEGDLIRNTIEMGSIVLNIKEFYPDINSFNIIKRLIACAEKNHDIITKLTSTEGVR